ncbi:YiiX/YebB-like N1pC/P60 family cysteine hydrolase [Phyllobacterium meliloti]|uniref:YiiX/YebB-like N1pC/P60 family cysteine hydrolase n=1 Tax=Phyllobacterium meliloti TaxID=555317 RepID=UPI001D155929|nr:YiiX/YebB-like N1pC/P60 family cysteine hydrolase [Phyllobacterium sp. T1293]UGX85126.1 hypothetical protein LLE53_011600 [Phyllobacterium sp. T1293]
MPELQTLPAEILRPDPATFEQGDFIWPKKPGVLVPYSTSYITEMKLVPTDFYDEPTWVAEKKLYLERQASDPASQLSATDRTRLAELSFAEFAAEYAGIESVDVEDLGTDTKIEEFALGTIVYVGHVGIIEIEGGKPFVIEAISGKGVIRHSYADWLSSRPGEEVWHGRIKNLSGEQRAKVAVEAKKYLGRPYEFFNFDLNDDSGFYCSKLVWLAAFRSLNIAIDGNSDSKRRFWFSPKQLMNSEKVQVLFSPGSYTNH